MKTHRENAYCMRFMQISSYEEKTHICGLCGPFKIQIHYADWENICADVLIQAVFFNWLISETHKRKSAWNPMWNPHDELYCKPCHKTSFYSELDLNKHDKILSSFLHCTVHTVLSNGHAATLQATINFCGSAVKGERLLFSSWMHRQTWPCNGTLGTWPLQLW